LPPNDPHPLVRIAKPILCCFDIKLMTGSNCVETSIEQTSILCSATEQAIPTHQRGSIMLKKLASIALCAAALLTAVSAAHADVKIFPAGSCYPFGSQSNDSDPDLFGRWVNRSSDIDAIIVCPLVRDVTDQRATSIQVSGVDNNSNAGENITCRASTVNRVGTSSNGGGTVSTSGANSAGQTLNVPKPAVNHINGSFIVVCHIPRVPSGGQRSHIASIRLTEP
jgi:hypothetical protein